MIKKKIIYGCEEGELTDSSPYLIRYTLIERKNWQICLHIFKRSDVRVLHDHPWSFVSLILWRGYVEETLSNRKRYWPGSLLFRDAKHVHRVELIKERSAVTLVWMGKRERQWGFHTIKGWIPWHKFC